ncbi:MAG TPA: hypothetical protein PLL80_01075 [Candidatus Pacearchaeota archaeon]|nr:hypothetical protein [Candidatus Pacearchaeota archaeon]HOK94171.1 hypothetical protein [Candidatus Pacearchaeota archaeon]HPO75189.1 hypothetical protein [Candidatus Pacearchaeota archaeon]
MPQALHSLYISNSSQAKNRNFEISKSKKVAKSHNKDFTFYFSIIISFLLIGCFVFYLYLAIEMVEVNFTLREKEKKLALLEEENKEIENQIRQALSLGEMEKKAKELALVKADNIQYLQFSQIGNLSQVAPKEENY